MRLYIDLDTLKWVKGPGRGQNPPEPFRIKRGDTVTTEIVFLSDGVATALENDDDLAFAFGVKLNGAFTSDFLIYSNDVTLPEDDNDPVYQLTFDANTTEVSDLIGAHAEYVDCVAELTWHESPDGGYTSTGLLQCQITNDVVRGDEGEPTSAEPDYPTAGEVSDVISEFNAVAQFNVTAYGAIGDGTTDDTAAIQTAINAAEAVGGEVILSPKTYRITSALVIEEGCKLRGAGVITHAGPAAADPGVSINIPAQSPYLSGSVLLMTTAATNAIEITAIGETVSLKDFGIRFADAIKFENTGHGIYQMPPDNVIDGVGTFKDNGPQNCEWSNIYVYGHDGDHYAFYSCNSLYNVITNVGSAGGGGWCHENNGHVTGDVEDYNQITGNVVLTNGSFFTFSGGTAHCVHVKRTAGPPAHITMVRPQGLSLNAASYGASTQPTSAQCLLKVDYGSYFIQIIQPAWENLRTGTASKVEIGAEAPGFFMTSASVVGHQPIAERGRDQGAGALPTLMAAPISWGCHGWGEEQKLIRINEPLDGNNFRRGFYAASSSGASDHISGWYTTDYGDSADWQKFGVGELNTAGDTYTWNQWVSQKGNFWSRGWVDGGSRYYKTLAANQTSITTTLANVTDMSVVLPAGTYELTGLWSFSNSAAGTGAKIDISFSQNLSATWKFSSVPDSGSQTPRFNAFSSSSQGSIGIVDTTGGQYTVIELHRARITVPLSTTVTVQFAQATLDAGINTVMLAGSYFEARRLSVG